MCGWVDVKGLLTALKNHALKKFENIEVSLALKTDFTQELLLLVVSGLLRYENTLFANILSNFSLCCFKRYEHIEWKKEFLLGLKRIARIF